MPTLDDLNAQRQAAGAAPIADNPMQAATSSVLRNQGMPNTSGGVDLSSRTLINTNQPVIQNASSPYAVTPLKTTAANTPGAGLSNEAAFNESAQNAQRQGSGMVGGIQIPIAQAGPNGEQPSNSFQSPATSSAPPSTAVDPNQETLNGVWHWAEQNGQNPALAVLQAKAFLAQAQNAQQQAQGVNGNTADTGAAGSQVSSAGGQQANQQQTKNPTNGGTYAMNTDNSSKGQQSEQTPPDSTASAIDNLKNVYAGIPGLGGIMASSLDLFKQEHDNNLKDIAKLGQLGSQSLLDEQSRLNATVANITNKQQSAFDSTKLLLDQNLGMQKEVADQAQTLQFQQNQDAKNQFDIEQGKLLRDAQIQKSLQISDAIVSGALTGGASISSAGAQGITYAEQLANNHLSDIQQQMILGDQKYVTQALKVSNDHTIAVNTATTNYNTNLTTAIQKFSDNYQNLQMQAFTDQSAIDGKILTFSNDLMKEVQAQNKNLTDAISTSAGKLGDFLISANRLQYDRNQAMLQRGQTIWENSLPQGGQPSAAIKAWAKEAAAMGIPSELTSPFLTGEPTARSIMPMYTYQGQQAANPNNYQGDPAMQKSVGYLTNILAGESDPIKRNSEFITLQQKYQSEGQSGVNQFLVQVAKSKLNADDQKTVGGDSDAITQINRIQNFLGDHHDELSKQNIATFNYEQLRKYAAQSKDPAFLQFYQDISLLNADELHKTYGARLTDTEIGFASNFLPTIKNEPIGDIAGKLEGLKTHMQNAIDGTFDRAFGTTPGGIYQGGGLGTAGTAPGSAPTTTDWSGDPNGAADELYKKFHPLADPPAGGTQITAPTKAMQKVDPATAISILQQAGFKGESLKTAYAVAMAESQGMYADANGDWNIANDTWGPSLGLFQIRSLRDPTKNPNRDAAHLTDPVFNAKAAYAISNGGTDWSPWSSYKNGGYKRYLTSVPTPES